MGLTLLGLALASRHARDGRRSVAPVLELAVDREVPERSEPATGLEGVGHEGGAEHRSALEPHSAAAVPALDARSPAEAARLVVVLLADGVPARQGSVSIASSRGARTVDVAARTGAAVFDGLDAGSEVRVRVAATPLGYLAPRSGLVRGAREQRVRLSGEETKLELELTAAAHVWGELSFDGGIEPPERALVRCMSLGAASGDELATVTAVVEEGRFSAYLPSGEWLFESTLARVAAAPVAVGSAEPRLGSFPPAARREVLEAGSSTRIDLRYVRGGLALRGRIVDEDGRAIAGVQVTVSPLEGDPQRPGDDAATRVRGLLRVDSDSEGRFEARGLIAGRYRVLVAPDCCRPLAAPGVNSLAEPIGALHARLGADGGHDPLELVAQRSRPMRAFGHVVVDPEWARLHGVLGETPRVTVELGVSLERAKPVTYDVALVDESYDFWIEAHELAVLTVELADRLVTYPLFLVPQDAPGGSPQILTFP